MSRKHRLEGLEKRIRRLRLRISHDKSELKALEKKAGFLRANIAVDAMPAAQRNALVLASMSTNLEPRPVIYRDE